MAIESINLMAEPGRIGEVLASSINNALIKVVESLPSIVMAAILAVAGWIVASFVAKFFRKLLEVVKFETFLKTHKVHDSLGNVRVSEVLIQVVKYFVILVFIQAAVAYVSAGPISEFLVKIVEFAPKVIGTVMVLLVAAIIGDLAKEKVHEVDRKEKHMQMIASLVKYVVVFMGAIVGFETLGFEISIISSTFLTLLQAGSFGIALAFGLAFGLGGQEAAKNWISRTKDYLNL
ncbi:hypothetical protein FJZ26_00990 [Candidatus Parvarchaeota archaeon]|nr:hypothetical protein [Candidatus Parvarchaeota archaeon]